MELNKILGWMGVIFLVLAIFNIDTYSLNLFLLFSTAFFSIAYHIVEYKYNKIKKED
ncbi:MAG: hypothetical protein ACOC3Z_03425 [Nanoarchaeota archaeon]